MLWPHLKILLPAWLEQHGAWSAQAPAAARLQGFAGGNHGQLQSLPSALGCRWMSSGQSVAHYLFAAATSSSCWHLQASGCTDENPIPHTWHLTYYACSHLQYTWLAPAGSSCHAVPRTPAIRSSDGKGSVLPAPGELLSGPLHGTAGAINGSLLRPCHLKFKLSATKTRAASTNLGRQPSISNRPAW